MLQHHAGELFRRGRKLLRLLQTPAYRRALRAGVAATVEHRGVPFRSDIATVIDVGANRGQFAVFARERFPSATIHCFEPLEAAATVLQDVFSADEHVHVHRIAASDHGGSRIFHVSRRADSSSLLPIGAGQVSAFPGTEEVRQLDVPTERLDVALSAQMLHSPVLLKIDVQGAELEVLRGAEAMLTLVDEVYVECSFAVLYEGQALAQEVIEYLGVRDFVLKGVYNTALSEAGAAVQADLHFGRVAPAPKRGPV